MVIMECRYEQLTALVAALNKINVPFIGFDGKKFLPCGVSDDLGMFYAVPHIAKIFGVSLDTAINIFLYSLVGISFIIGLCAFFALYKTALPRIIAAVGLFFVAKHTLHAGDVYVAYGASVMAGVPLFLYASTLVELNKTFTFFMLLLGLFLGFLHNVRAFCSVPVLLFIVIITAGQQYWHMRTKIWLILALFCGAAIPSLYFSYLFKIYENYAFAHGITTQKIPSKHIFWHSAYIGLGFLNNNFDIKYADACGAHKAQSLDPAAVYPCERYEQVLKEEVIRLCSQERGFVLHTVFAKIGVLFYFLLRYLGIIGIFIALFYRKQWVIELAFLCGLLFSSLFGILIMPAYSYIIGFISFSIIYTIVSINHAILSGALRRFITKNYRAAACNGNCSSSY